METLNINNVKNSKDSNKARTKIANDWAKEKGFNGAEDYINIANEKMNSSNEVIRNNGIQMGRDMVTSLLQLCLYQKVEHMDNLGYMDFCNTFDDGIIANGNSKEYIASRLTGSDTWLPNQFIPTKRSKKSVEHHVLQMYDGSGALNAKAYQFKKSTTIEQAVWLPYFKSGKLGEFINELENQAYNTYKIYKYNKIATLITSSSPANTIQGTAKDMFDSFADEILPAIRRMKYLNSNYNFNASSKYLQLNTTDDLLLIMSANNIQRLQSGIKSQLFNAHMLDIGNILDEKNVICLGNKITIGTGEQEITVSATDEYCDDNTIYVISKNALKHLTQINRAESQAWAENLTIQNTLHIWGVVDFLPWGQMFKYTNANLSKLPAGN